MTDNIIQFPKKLNGSTPDPEPMEIEVLVFSCGHTAGHLQSDGTIKCSTCYEVVDNAGWAIIEDEDDPELS